jgi:hypothetical protein
MQTAFDSRCHWAPLALLRRDWESLQGVRGAMSFGPRHHTSYRTTRLLRTCRDARDMKTLVDARSQDALDPNTQATENQETPPW